MNKLCCAVKQLPPAAQGHRHEYAHIIIPTGQPVQLSFLALSYSVRRMQMLYVPPGVYHMYCGGPAIVFDIPPHMINDSDLGVLRSNCLLDVTAELEPVLRLIETELRQGPGSRAMNYLFYYIYDKFLLLNRSLSLQYISENFAEDVRVSDLAELENYNVSYFCEWFKKQTGLSPGEYLQKVRIERARDLLVTTNYRILDIAVQVGYRSNSAFARAFRQSAGISPSEYRATRRDPSVREP